MLERVLSLVDKITAKFQDYIHTTYVEALPELLQSIGISLCMVLVVWLVELYYVGWQKSGMRRVLVHPSRSTINDIFYYILYVTGAVIVLAWIMSFGLPVMIRLAVRDFIDLNLGQYLGGFLHLLAYLVMLDFFMYWQHRLMHRIPVLWHIHAFHHSASEFNTITVFRERPLDKALAAVTSLIPAILLGVPVAQYPLFITVYGIIGYLKHSQIPWRMGWFGKYVVHSPIDHWIHHSVEFEHYDQNFANSFAIWDHLFGTYYKGDKINTAIGLPDEPYNQRFFLYDIMTPQIRVMRDLIPARLRKRESQA